MRHLLHIEFGLLAFLAVTQSALAKQYENRSEIPTEAKWKLEDLYPTDEAWAKAKDETVGRFDEVLAYKGKLAESPEQLLGCLKLSSDISRAFGQLFSYAHMKSDEDTRESKYLAMKQQMQQHATDFSSLASFIEPEIVAISPEKIEKFISDEPGLRPYRMYLGDLQRKKAHRLSEKEEKIIAEAGLMASGPSSIFGVFSNAEMPFPEIELSDGKKVLLNQAGYCLHRASANRADRQAVFQAFWSKYNEFKQTFGVQLYAQVKTDVFSARVRNYDSCLAASLDEYNIPTAVYMALVDNVNRNLDSFHRYLKLKKRMLGVDRLEYCDIYAPVVSGVELNYSYEEAQKLILDALKPLGSDYCAVVKQSFKDRWIDVYPTPGKRMGAYSNGSAYDVHPYILLNYNGQYDDVSTLAHELGHTMHSYYSNKEQPFPTADYSTFVAEVASTFNEALLIDKMLADIKDDDVRLSLLMNYLDGLKGTVFRQTQFAEFELRAHEKAEAGEPLTGDALTEVYAEILKRYYGHDKGICYIDDLYTVEWAYIPHFYYNFYVYQYSTSFTASTALSEKVLSKTPGAVEKYLKFISAGSSDYPIELLKGAGVDMTSSDPFDNTMKVMNRTMDRIEEILARR